MTSKILIDHVFKLQRWDMDKIVAVMRTARDYDNAFGYTVQKKSKIIENLLLGFPQAFNVTVEPTNNGYLFLHGYQDVKAISDFVQNNFCLKSMSQFDCDTGHGVCNTFNGKTYKNLTSFNKELFDHSQPIDVYVLKQNIQQSILDTMHDRLIY